MGTKIYIKICMMIKKRVTKILATLSLATNSKTSNLEDFSHGNRSIKRLKS